MVQKTLEHIKIVVQYYVISVEKQTMRPVSVDTRDKCSAMTVDLKVINPDDALINRNSAMMPFQSSLYHVKTNFLS